MEDDFYDMDTEEKTFYDENIDHVANHLLRKPVNDRGPIGCKQSTGKIRSWDLNEESEHVKKYVERSGLKRIVQGSYRSVSRVIISAFVERWHPETNTFHMPFGEMTITLDDVVKILGIKVKWTPYREREKDPKEVCWFYGCLVVDDIAKPYYPNRVVRQFGRVQDEPSSPMRPKINPRTKARTYDNRPEEFEKYERHLVPKSERGAHAIKDDECTTAYTEWYNRVAIRQLDSSSPPVDIHGTDK